MAYSGGQQVFSPYAAMGNSPGMMIDPNGELTKDAQPVQDNGMDYAGLDAIAVRAFMDGVMSGLYNINFMFGSNTMVMASGGGSAGVQDVGQVWLPKYTDNMNMCNVFRAALSDVPSDIVGIKGFTIAPDNSIYVTYSYVTHSSRPSEEGEDGGTYNLIDQYALSERTTKFSLPPRGDLQKQQHGDFWAILGYVGMGLDVMSNTAGTYGKWEQTIWEMRNSWRPGYTAPLSKWTSVAKVLSNLGWSIGIAGLAHDGYMVSQNSMSQIRFTYHLGGLATSTYIGAKLGGWYGAAAGVIFWGGEQAYDRVVEPYVVEPARVDFNYKFNLFINEFINKNF